MFIAITTTASHWFLSRARWIQRTNSHVVFKLNLYTILHLCLGLPNGPFVSDFPTHILHAIISYAWHTSCPALLPGLTTLIWRQQWKLCSSTLRAYVRPSNVPSICGAQKAHALNSIISDLILSALWRRNVTRVRAWPTVCPPDPQAPIIQISTLA